MKAILTAVLATSLAAFGQSPPTPPSPADQAQHHVKFLTTVLSLTAKQQQDALTVFTAAAASEQEARDGVRAAHDTLRDAEKTGDSMIIDQTARTIGQLTSQMVAIRSKANAAFYQTLTQKQQSKLSELESDGPGPGGPGSGGPPAF